MKFQKGQSGNPAGRKPGTVVRHHVLELQKKHEPEALELFYIKSKELGLEGDLTGLKEIYKSSERIRSQAIPINLVGTIDEQIKAIQEAATEGKLTPHDVCSLSTAVTKLFEATDVNVRLTALEEEVKKQKMQQESDGDSYYNNNQSFGTD